MDGRSLLSMQYTIAAYTPRADLNKTDEFDSPAPPHTWISSAAKCARCRLPGLPPCQPAVDPLPHAEQDTKTALSAPAELRLGSRVIIGLLHRCVYS